MIGFTRPKRFCVPENKHYTAVETKSLDALEAACEKANVEIERLRAELAKLQDDFKSEKREHELTWQRMAKRTDDLAATQALLREALEAIDFLEVDPRLCDRIRAALGDESTDKQTNDASGNQP